MPDKVSRDKIAKKSKSKTIKTRSPHGNRSSIASKVWDTLAAVRKSRGPHEIVDAGLIVRLDGITGPTCYVNPSDNSNSCHGTFITGYNDLHSTPPSQDQDLSSGSFFFFFIRREFFYSLFRIWMRKMRFILN